MNNHKDQMKERLKDMHESEGKEAAKEGKE